MLRLKDLQVWTILRSRFRVRVESAGHELRLPRQNGIQGQLVLTSTKTRSAAWVALRISLLTFGSTVLMLPLFSVFRRVFDGTWSVPWRMMLTVSGILAGLIFAFLFLAQVFELSAQDYRERNARLVFPAAMWLRGLYLVSIVMGLGLMAGTYSEGAPWGIVVLPVLFVFLGFFAWPRAVEITDRAVRQWGVLFGFKEILLGEIESVVCDPRRNETIVFGKNGNRIVHSAMHIDGERFVERLGSLTGKSSNYVGIWDEPC